MVLRKSFAQLTFHFAYAIFPAKNWLFGNLNGNTTSDFEVTSLSTLLVRLFFRRVSGRMFMATVCFCTLKKEKVIKEEVKQAEG